MYIPHIHWKGWVVLIDPGKKNVVYYESIKREVKTKLVHECRCDERLKPKLRDLHVSHTLGSESEMNR